MEQRKPSSGAEKKTACEIGDQVILVYPAGMEATAQILTKKLYELKRIMSADEIFDMKEMLKRADALKDLEMIERVGVHAVCDDMKFGVLGALYLLGQKEHIGIFVQLEHILLLKPTKFICKHYGLNPFRIPSGGCRLVVAKPSKGQQLLARLKEESIAACVIGEVVEGNEVYYLVNDTRLPIAKPTADEMGKI